MPKSWTKWWWDYYSCTTGKKDSDPPLGPRDNFTIVDYNNVTLTPKHRNFSICFPVVLYPQAPPQRRLELPIWPDLPVDLKR
jgi:hypothetical protein